MNAAIEIKFAKFLSFGTFLTTVIIVSGPVTDPVNVPKLAVIGALAFGLIPNLILNRFDLKADGNRINIILVAVFVGALTIAAIASPSPFSQNFYGVFGRNNGFLSFACLVLIYLATSILKERKSFDLLLLALGASGLINILYAIIVQLFGDPIPWKNIYRALLGTFGNPDFAGSFCGIVTGFFLAIAIGTKSSLKTKITYYIFFFGSLFAIYETKTKQGILVAAITIAVVLYFLFSKVIKKRILTISYSSAIVVIGLLSILGMLQKGPLSTYLYKETVSLRGSYWDSAFNAGSQHLFTGIGLDALGDWYRRVRSLKAATWLPGPDVITNAAHNYYLDIFASGGVLLFLSFLSFTILGIINIYRIYVRTYDFDYIAVALTASFIGFQAQAIISIPQLGLAIWGWVLMGALHSYAMVLSKFDQESKPSKKTIANADSPVGVFIFASMCVGLSLAIPPYSADAKWMSATKSQQLQQVEAALEPSYFNPPNTTKYVNAILLLENSKLYPEAHKYAKELVKFNPQFFEGWRSLYFATDSTVNERKLALAKMHELDPLNKKLDVLK